MSVQTGSRPAAALPTLSAASLSVLERDKYQGGEATLHLVRWGTLTCLYKEYDQAGTADPRHLARLASLVATSPEPTSVALPLAAVQVDGEIAGYLMAPAPERFYQGGVPRHLSMLASDDDEYTPARRLAFLGALLKQILRLHDAGVVVGDLKSLNVLIAAPGDDDDLIFIVDCDSFSFTDDAKASQPYTDHMLPPHWHDRPKTRQTDLYQFALLAERVLTGDFSVSPDTDPLPDHLRQAMQAWHWQVLNLWKELDRAHPHPATRLDARRLAGDWLRQHTELDTPCAPRDVVQVEPASARQSSSTTESLRYEGKPTSPDSRGKASGWIWLFVAVILAAMIWLVIDSSGQKEWATGASGPAQYDVCQQSDFPLLGVKFLRQGDGAIGGTDANSAVIRSAQSALQFLGYGDRQPILANGSLAQETQAALRTFQQDQGLYVDGVLGPRTWATLHDEANQRSMCS